jgi:hypothetical protein
MKIAFGRILLENPQWNVISWSWYNLRSLANVEFIGY